MNVAGCAKRGDWNEARGWCVTSGFYGEKIAAERTENTETVYHGTHGEGRDARVYARRTSAGCAGRREAAACDALAPVRSRPCPSVPVVSRSCLRRDSSSSLL